MPIHGLTELSGRVTVAGRVVNVERRDIPGKEMVLLSFVLTDFTDSINCKIFLRYRNGRFNGNGGDAAPPTAEEVRQLEDVIAQVMSSKGLKVRGVCQYDSYSKCLVLMAQDISAHEIARRKDTAEHKRVELHAHTQMR